MKSCLSRRSEARQSMVDANKFAVTIENKFHARVKLDFIATIVARNLVDTCYRIIVGDIGGDSRRNDACERYTASCAA